MFLRAWITSVSFVALLHAEILRVPLGLDAYVPAPENSAVTREKEELGRPLFFWKGLSRDRSLSCAGCHIPEKALSDGRARAVRRRGQVRLRRTPALCNR